MNIRSASLPLNFILKDWRPIALIRQCWSQSRGYRVVLVAALVYFMLRLAVQVVYLSGAGQSVEDTTSFNGQFVPSDLVDYLEAAQRLENRQDLYLSGSLDRVEFYQYSPAYALAFTVFLHIPVTATLVVLTILHLVVYALLYVWWSRLFRRLGLSGPEHLLAWTLPVWLIFAAFWGDLVYLNIFMLMALLATLLIEAIMDEKLGWSAFWLTLLILTKPHWAFAAALPLLLGRRSFFLRLMGLTALLYVSVLAVTSWIVGPAYGWEQHLDYYRFLWELRGSFPWRGPEAGFLGYNHSITQIIVFFLGISPFTLQLATWVKVLIFAPLGLIGVQYLLRPINRRPAAVPDLSLELLFALYLAAFIWLDYVWEASLSIVIFAYLLAREQSRTIQIALWVVYMSYALLDMWRLIAYISFGETEGYVWADPSLYFPIVMLVILAFYGLLIKRLWLKRDVFAESLLPLEEKQA